MAKSAIEKLDDDVLREYTTTEKLVLKLDDEQFTLSGDELEIERISKENYAVESDDGYSVAVSTLLDNGLIQEGYAREVVNKIQNMRKSADFKVTDRIRVSVKSTGEVKSALDNFGDYVKGETLADELLSGDIKGEVRQEWDINGQPATITIART
jgi:isoleucyl-tRNA synthetase